MVNKQQIVGARIKEFRIAQNLTQERLAKMIGISSVYLSGIENGQRNPTLDVLVKLSEGLDVPLGRMFKDL